MSVSLLSKAGANTSSLQMASFFYRALTDGVLTGCDCNVVSGSITVDSGVVLMGGFMVAVEAETITPTAGDEIVIKINISDGTATISTRTATTLTQDDLFNGGYEYEVQLATYAVLGSSVSAVKKTLGTARANSGITTGSAEPANPSKGDIWFVTE